MFVRMDMELNMDRPSSGFELRSCRVTYIIVLFIVC